MMMLMGAFANVANLTMTNLAGAGAGAGLSRTLAVPPQMQTSACGPGFADRVGMLLANDTLGSAWGAMIAPFSLALGPGDAPQGVSELSRGQSFQAGDKNIFTDGNGNVDVDIDGRLEGVMAAVAGFTGGCGCGNGNSLSRAGLGQSGAAQFGAVGVAAQKKPGQKLGFKDGNIQLPNGKQIPFGNTGAIVVMPDGSQVAVGRQGNEQVRTAYGAPGQQIPVSPPGQTNVFYLNEAGDVVRQEVR